MATDKVRLNFYMKPNLVERLDKFASQMGLERGAALSYITATFFEQRDNLNTAQEMLKFFNTKEGKEALLRSLEAKGEADSGN